MAVGDQGEFPFVGEEPAGDGAPSPDAFRAYVWACARLLDRPMPWREEPSPYYVLVSEMMLQQTQVSRAIERFPTFIGRFPSLESLADAAVGDVVSAWSGLGYNRRARFLRETARIVCDRHGGRLPHDPKELVELPGIGAGTAGSLAAFAYNRPTVFLETNIRRVVLHHYFPGREGVSDAEILPVVAATLDRDRPRLWYYALMDYGSSLARRVPNPNRRSSHYTRQTQFRGSVREARGAILRALAEGPRAVAELERELDEGPLAVDQERFSRAVEGLLRDGLVEGGAHLSLPR